jgi:hypothetical protein
LDEDYEPLAKRRIAEIGEPALLARRGEQRLDVEGAHAERRFSSFKAKIKLAR